jgi:dolichyl-diphosphooligosaccharide--protein glycosyltransferase
MAWWDYGYQITGIGERTTIADGNTWNHEHIATLGYCLASPTAKAHTLIRHLADYVLVWSGGYQDDLAKSPHMARIGVLLVIVTSYHSFFIIHSLFGFLFSLSGNSVYNDLCPKDPTCDQFSFVVQDPETGTLLPTPMMAKSLLFNLISTHPKAYVSNKFFTKVLVVVVVVVVVFLILFLLLVVIFIVVIIIVIIVVIIIAAVVVAFFFLLFTLFSEISIHVQVFGSKYDLVRIYKVANVSQESKAWVLDPANRVCDHPGSWYCVGQYPPAGMQFYCLALFLSIFFVQLALFSLYFAILLNCC